MLRLPKTVVIGHRTYKVRELKKRNGEEGLCEYTKGLIWVRSAKRPPSEAACTLLHEMFHAIWDSAALGECADEESAVEALSNGLTQIIRDNPEVFDWIAEKARS